MGQQNRTVVVGIGNTIRGDDGVGILLARKLKEILPPRFEVRESVTVDLDLIETISGYGRAILIDAIRTRQGVAGQVHLFSLRDFKCPWHLPSSHSLGLGQIVHLGKRLMGEQMPDVQILAVEAKKLDEFSESLSSDLQHKFDQIVEVARAKIENMTQ